MESSLRMAAARTPPSHTPIEDSTIRAPCVLRPPRTQPYMLSMPKPGRSCIRAEIRLHPSRTLAACRWPTDTCIWEPTIACCTVLASPDDDHEKRSCSVRHGVHGWRDCDCATSSSELADLRWRRSTKRLGKSGREDL